MSQFLGEDKFYEYIEKLKEVYAENPKRATKEAKASLKRLSSEKKALLDEKAKPIFFIAMYFVFIVLMGLINLSQYPSYIFGMVFFIAGALVGAYVKGFGLFFLFSHGMTGLGLMIAGQIGELFSSSFLSDAPKEIYYWLVAIFLLILFAMIITILFNLSDSLREKRYFVFVPLILFGIAIVLTVLLSKYLWIHFGLKSTFMT